jgi:DNA invertase Pin-like site-specific DNA recombinase
MLPKLWSSADINVVIARVTPDVLALLGDGVPRTEAAIVAALAGRHLQDIVHELKAKGVALRATEQPVDTGTAAGKAFLDMLGVFAEFETNLRRERQLEGIKAAKKRGVYKGRQPSVDAAEVRRLRDEEKLRPVVIARRLGIGRSSVYRALGAR